MSLFNKEFEKKLLTLKDIAIITNKSEGFIKSKIAKGLLIKYDKFGKPLVDPIKHKGFFKIGDIKKVFDIEPNLNKLAEPNYNNKTEYKEIDVTPQEVIKISQPNFEKKLEGLTNKRFDVCIVVFDVNPGELKIPFKFESNSEVSQKIEKACKSIAKISDMLKDNGSLLIYDIPKRLPYYAISLADELVFKYWIAVREFNTTSNSMFDPVATGILFMVKKNENFVINTIREPHKKCRYCQEILKDYGGKKHLMHQKGAALSDVWKSMKINSYSVNKLHRIPKGLLKRILNVTCTNDSHVLLVKLKDAIDHERT